MGNYYYDEPVQVKYFYDDEYHGAIAFRDVLIDGRTGQVYNISELLQSIYKTYGIDAERAITEYDWVNLSEVIIYGEVA
jgi:hypothetical protein